MSTTSPDAPTSTLPVPQPTHPVAERPVAAEEQEFRWTVVPDAETYRLQLAESGAFDTLYYDDTVEAPVSLDLAEVLPAEVNTVVWRVRAETEEPMSWSTAASFAVGEGSQDADGQLQVDAPPVPIRPIAGDEVDVERITLTWEGVPEATGYRVQVAHTEAFEDPVVDLTVDQTTTLTLFDALRAEKNQFFWRVQVLFSGAVAGEWSDTVQFAINPGLEDDFEPEGGEEEAEPTSFKRSAVAAGPAREAYTSSGMAFTFIVVLAVSFTLTILAIMML